MSRLSRRRSLGLAATALVVLAAPAAAQAATYTVKAGDGACGPGDLACGGLVEAAAIATAGDVFNVGPGTYPSAKFTTDVTIAGDLGFVVDGTLEFAGDRHVGGELRRHVRAGRDHEDVAGGGDRRGFDEPAAGEVAGAAGSIPGLDGEGRRVRRGRRGERHQCGSGESQRATAAQA